MSLAATLRPASLPFSSTLAGVYSQATDNASTTTSFAQDSNYLTLNRMLIRFQNLILLVPSPLLPKSNLVTSSTVDELSPLQRQIQAELYSALPYHRTKWLHNIQGARNLLLQLERQAQGIKVQRTKREVLKDLSEKRSAIKRLRNRVEEIGREVETMGDKARNSRQTQLDEELLGDRVEDVLGDRLHARIDKRVNIAKDDLLEGKPVANITQENSFDGDSQRQRDDLFGPSLRRRQGQGQDESSTAELSATPAARKDGQSSGFSNLGSTEKSLGASSRTHEDLTASLVSMAAQLKQQARAFEFTLTQDKGLLDRALEGLDRNVSAMDLASRNMAYLRRMSEGEGWLGRMKLYGIIFAMWVFAILLVFVLPKLRF